MRLIDADLWIEKLKNCLVQPNYHPDLGDAFQCMEAEEHNEEIICMIETVNEQPTAYDVDKVAEQLENEKLESIEMTCDIVRNCTLNDAIRIVKGGGQVDRSN